MNGNDSQPSVVTRARVPMPWTFLALAAAVGTYLKVVAASSSLWVDELHSLAHGLEPDLASVFNHTHFDFHAPLFFTAVHWVGSWEHPHGAKVLTIVASALTLIPLAALARRLRGGRASVVIACGLFATMPYFTYYGQELRPYPFLMLATVTAAWAAWSDDGPAWLRGLVFALAVGFGLNTHYMMPFAVLGIGLARLVTAIPYRRADEVQPLPLKNLIGVGALGALLILPWVFGYMSWAIKDPTELVPSSVVIPKVAWREFFEAPLRILAPRLESLGSWCTPLGIYAFIGTLVALVAGICLWIAARFRSKRRPFATSTAARALVLLILLIPLTGYLSIQSWGRVGLQYYAIPAFAIPLVLAEILAGVEIARWRNALTGLILLCALAGGIAQAHSAPREDMQRGVEIIRQELTRVKALGLGDPWITAVMRQPPSFDQGLAFSAYGSDLHAVEPHDVPGRPSPGSERPLIVLVRRWDGFIREITERQEFVRRLAEGRVVERQIKIDDAISVYVLVPKP